MSFLWNFVTSSVRSPPPDRGPPVSQEFPLLTYYHELIAGSRHTWSAEDADDAAYREFKAEFSLENENQLRLKSKIFQRIGQPPRSLGQPLVPSKQTNRSWIFNDEEDHTLEIREFHEKIGLYLDSMKTVNRVLERKICVFAKRNHRLMKEALPEILDLQGSTNALRRQIVKMRIINLARTKRTQQKNLLIRRKFLRQRRLQKHLQLLRSRVMSNLNFLQLCGGEGDAVDRLRRRLRLIGQNGKAAPTAMLESAKRRAKLEFLTLWAGELMKDEPSEKLDRKLMELVRCVHEEGILGDLESLVLKLLGFCLEMVVTKNLENVVFKVSDSDKTSRHIPNELREHIKLEVMVPLMNSQSLCSFFKVLFKDLVRLFEAVDRFLCFLQLQGRTVRVHSKDKSDAAFFENLSNCFLRKKRLLVEDVARILKQIFGLVNQDEIGEIGVSSVLGLLRGYEQCLRCVQIFSFHFPDVPNEVLSERILKPYIQQFKQKSIRMCFHEVLDEDWRAFEFKPQHFLDRIDKFLKLIESADLQTSKLTAEEIESFRLDRNAYVAEHSFQGPQVPFTSSKKYSKWVATPNKLAATPMSKSLAGEQLLRWG